MILYRILRHLKSIVYILINRHRFKYIGKNVRIYSPLKIDGKPNIYIGNNVTVEYKTWLAAIPADRIKYAKLEICDGATIGHFNHIYATESIKIGQNVLTADKVYISDNLHGYENINIPIQKQPIRQIAHVEIGDGSWIGEYVCIIGASIGKGCVIGSNAVVTHNIPDYCVAVGIPAKVIKQFNTETKQWERI